MQPGADPPAYPEVAQAFHIANFVPANWGVQDPISRSLVAFRHGIEPETTQWIRLVLQGIVGLPSAGLIVRALASDELTSGGTASLDRLGVELGARTGGIYEPHRLAKGRPARAVKNAGPRPVRDHLLAGAYHFDSTGLEDTVSILIIDDIVTTGATFAAIAGAIRAVLPGAAIRYLALGRTDPWLVRLHLGEEYSGSEEAYRESLVGNRHLDERYFTGAAPTAERGRPAGRLAPSAGRTRVEGPLPQDGNSPVRVFGEEEAADAAAEQEPGQRPGNGSATEPAGPPAGGAGSQPFPGRLMMLLIGATTLLALIVTIFFLTQRDARDPVLRPPPEPEPTTFTPPKEGVRRTETPVLRPDRRIYGTINVPTVGLRPDPSISSPPIADVLMTEGERVVLVKTSGGEVGPGWIFIQTARGARGWVLASVVTRSP